MEQMGLGVMISMLGGNADSVAAFAGAVGRTISSLTLGEDDALHFVFEDGSKVMLFDDGQGCCENRYMRTDDNLAEFVGSKLLGAAIKKAPSVETGDECHDVEFLETHDVEFLEVQTDRGVFTMAIHNEHNGYYGWFSIRAAVE